MEINPSSTGYPDQSIVWTTDDNDLQGSGQARSYTCAFCKRGFSNAQALGGHMNIHRRDRARLKQASHGLSLDLTESSGGVTTDHDDHRDEVSGDKGSSKTASGDEASSTMKRASYPRSVGGDDVDATRRIPSEDVGEELLRLPLSLAMKIGDTSSSSGIEDKKMQLSHGSSDQSELVDLELRLGPEPRDDTPTKITRDFF